MKKSIICLAAILLLSGCFKDERNNFMVPDSLGVASNDGIVEATVHTGSCIVGIIKSGRGLSEARVRVNLDTETCAPLLEAYNKSHKTAYESVMGSLVEATRTEFSFAAEDASQNLELRWDAELMARFMGAKKNYVIPVLIESETADVAVAEGRNFILVHLNRSAVELKQEKQVRSIERKWVEGEDALLTEDIVLDFAINNPLKGVELTFPVIIDNSLIPAFNEGKETPFQADTKGLISLKDSVVVLPAKAISTAFHIRLDKGKLLKDGKLTEFQPYVIPVRIQQEGLKARQGQANVDIKALTFGNMVCYITVSPAAKGITVVEREWGLYSDSGAWYQGLEGFAGGADRTIAMDKDYVYVAHSSDTPAIYAINRRSGLFEKKLDVSTAAENGCTFPVSCVRMIKNNKKGEDDILSFCSLKGEDKQHLFVYAYQDGIDKAPVKILDYLLDKKPAPGVDDFRRYGDRYTVKGSWQDGELWFHTWSADGTTRGKTVVFTLKDGVVTNPDDPKSYLLDGSSGEDTAIRDISLYPGWDDVLVTRHNAAGIFHNTGDNKDNGWIKWNKTQDLPKLKLTYGYQFFDFHEENFIAYVQLDEENATGGRLVIIDDAATAPAQFPDQLQAQTNRREFPVQHPTDFKAQSGVPASSSVGDCAFCEVNGNTYIAVLIQGCGLSLFQLQ